MGNFESKSELRQNLQLIYDRFFANVLSDGKDMMAESAPVDLETAQESIDAFIEVSREITAQPGLSSSGETSQISESAAESYRNTRIKTGS